jgi:hypothetical protein
MTEPVLVVLCRLWVERNAARRLCLAMANRIADQAELLARRAERKEDPRMTERMLGKVQVHLLATRAKRQQAADKLDLPTSRKTTLKAYDQDIDRLARIEDYLIERLGRADLAQIVAVDGQTAIIPRSEVPEF